MVFCFACLHFSEHEKLRHTQQAKAHKKIRRRLCQRHRTSEKAGFVRAVPFDGGRAEDPAGGTLRYGRTDLWHKVINQNRK